QLAAVLSPSIGAFYVQATAIELRRPTHGGAIVGAAFLGALAVVFVAGFAVGLGHFISDRRSLTRPAPEPPRSDELPSLLQSMREVRAREIVRSVTLTDPGTS